MSVFEQGRVLEDAPPCATGRACRCTQSCYEFAFFFFGNLTVAYNKLSTIVPVRALKHTLCRFVAQCGFFSISQVLLRASWLTFRLSYGDERSVHTPAPQMGALANLGMQLQYMGAAFWKAWGRLVEMSFPGCFLPLVKQDNFFFFKWKLRTRGLSVCYIPRIIWGGEVKHFWEIILHCCWHTLWDLSMIFMNCRVLVCFSWFRKQIKINETQSLLPHMSSTLQHPTLQLACLNMRIFISLL